MEALNAAIAVVSARVGNRARDPHHAWGDEYDKALTGLRAVAPKAVRLRSVRASHIDPLSAAPLSGKIQTGSFASRRRRRFAFVEEDHYDHSCDVALVYETTLSEVLISVDLPVTLNRIGFIICEYLSKILGNEGGFPRLWPRRSGRGHVMSDETGDRVRPKPRVRSRPARTAKGAQASAERERRLAAALRANLRKRKAQVSARGAGAQGEPPAAPGRQGRKSD